MPFTTRRNLCLNPSFEVNTTGYGVNPTYWNNAGSTITQDAGFAASGTKSGKVVCDGTAGQQGCNYTAVGLKPNTAYTISAVISSVSGRLIQMRIRDIVNLINKDSDSNSFVASGSTGRVRQTITTGPTGNVSLLIGITTDITLAASTFYVDNVLIEETNTLQDYFDGNSSKDGYRYSWTGTVNNSECIEEKISDVIYRRNTTRNSKCRGNATDWAFALGGGTGTGARMTDGNLVIPETGQIITTYYRATWTVPPVGIASTGIVNGSSNVDGSTVVGGKNHSFSCYAKTSHLNRQMAFVITFHNIANTQVGTYTSPTVDIGGSSWVKITGTYLTPIDAVRAYIRIYPQGGGTDWLAGETIDATALMVEQSDTVQPYFDGDSPILSQTDRIYWATIATPDASQSVKETAASPALLPRRNKAPNPSGESAAGWLTNNGTYWVVTNDTTVFHSGSQSKLCTPQAAALGNFSSILTMYNIGGSPWPASPGRIYVISAWVRHNSAVAGTKAMLGYAFLDSAGSSIAPGVVNSPYTVIPQNTWTRISMITAAAPSNAATLRVTAIIDKALGLMVAAGELGWIDDCLVNEGTTLVREYFDGSSPAANGYSYQWVGTPDASESIEINTAPETRRNITPNPGAQPSQPFAYWGNNSAGGGISVAFVDVADGPVSKKSFKATWTSDATVDTGGIYIGSSTSRYNSIRDGETLTASMYVRSNRTQRLAILWYAYDVSNTLKGNGSGAQVVLNPNEWTRISAVGFRVPALSDHLIIAAYTVLGTGFTRWVTGNTLEGQGALVENSDVLGTYFDGDGPSTSLATTRWMGTSYGSESVLSAGSTSASRGDNIYAGLVAGGYYSPPAFSSVADMERRRLLSKLGLTEPQKLSMADLYVLAGEKNRLPAFRR